MKQKITSNPVALAGLAQDTVYRLQNRSAYPLFVQRAAARANVDNDGSGGFRVDVNEMLPIEKLAGTEVYVWAQYGGGQGFAVYEEIPA